MPVRPFRPSDEAEVRRLHLEVGWRPRSAEGWRWLRSNPAHRDYAAPHGWVVTDDDDQAVAFLGNLVLKFRLSDRDLVGVTGFNLIVPASQRGRSRDLLAAFVAQPDVFAAWIFNANPLSAPLYGRFEMLPWPETHALKLSWIVDPLACMEGRLWRTVAKAAPKLAPRLGERLMNPRLTAAPHLTLPPGVAVLSDLADRSRYGEFWTALKDEGRLVADRSPETLRWRVADPDLTRPPLMLAFNRGRRITGIAMAILGKGAAIDPPFLEIVDLMALEGEADAIPALVKALIVNARTLGAAKVRLPLVSPRLVEQLGPLAAKARREGGWGHCHVKFAEDAPDPALWSPTAYDADYAICLREPPAALTASRTSRRAAA